MFTKKNIIVLMLILILSVTFTACSKNESDASDSKIIDEDNVVSEELTQYPLTIVDGFDRSVTIESEPMKIISIAPSITETIYAVGGEEKLVARTDYCDYPSAVSDIPSIGTLTDPSIEDITNLNPDLIIASTHFKKDVLSKLEELGFKVVVLLPNESFDGVYDTISNVGKLLNKNKNADKVIEGMKTKVEKIENLAKDLEPVDVYYVVGFGEYGDYTATGDTYISDIIEMAGGNNVAKDGENWSYSLEKIIEKDPTILVCSKYFGAKDGILAANGYKDLTAVKNGNLFEIDNNLIDRQGPRLADGLVELFKIIHPGVYK